MNANVLQNRIDKKFSTCGYDWSKCRDMPLPEYDWQNGSPKEFHTMFVKNPHPVVLRGFLKGTKMMDYTFDKILEKFGEENVLLADDSRTSVQGQIRKLKDVTQKGVYLNNSEVLFNKYPELWEALETHRLEPYIEKKSMFAQLFMGCKGTGTRIHSAHVWNFFHMIDGKKKWYFIDPTDWYYLYPMYFGGINNGFHIAFYPDEFDEKYLPAVKYCPYYTVELEPGDVMLNPAWWSHGIRNTTEKSVGIATRWVTNGIYGGNFCTAEEDYHIHRFASWNFLTGYRSIGVLHNYLKEINSKFDEHEFMTKREVEGTRFKPMVKKLFVDGDAIDGWRPIF